MALTKVTGQVILPTTDLTVGVLSVTNTLAIGGSVSIGGTLTYEDVTNIDSVGLITARNGIVVGSGITLSKDGDIFATGVTTSTTFVGALTGNVTGDVTGAATKITVTDQSGDTTCNVLFAQGATGDITPHTGTNLTFNSSTGALTATSFSGDGAGLSNVGVDTGVVFTDKLSLGDSEYINVGLGSDLKIYHNGTDSVIQEAVNNRRFLIAGDEIAIRKGDLSEDLAKFNADGAVELYHNNLIKLATTVSGIELAGVENAGSQLKIGASGDFTIEHDGSNTYIKNTTGNTVIQNDAHVTINASSGGTQRFRFDSDGLKFGTATSSANALNSYEEGTFTVGVQNGWGILNPTYDYNEGYYVKVGDIVCCTFRMKLSGGSTNGNQIYMTGLPFSALNVANKHYPMWSGYFASAASDAENVRGWTGPNQTYVYFIKTGGTGTAVYTGTMAGNSFDCYWTCTYRTN